MSALEKLASLASLATPPAQNAQASQGLERMSLSSTGSAEKKQPQLEKLSKNSENCNGDTPPHTYIDLPGNTGAWISEIIHRVDTPEYSARQVLCAVSMVLADFMSESPKTEDKKELLATCFTTNITTAIKEALSLKPREIFAALDPLVFPVIDTSIEPPTDNAFLVNYDQVNQSILNAVEKELLALFESVKDSGKAIAANIEAHYKMNLSNSDKDNQKQTTENAVDDAPEGASEGAVGDAILSLLRTLGIETNSTLSPYISLLLVADVLHEAGTERGEAINATGSLVSVFSEESIASGDCVFCSVHSIFRNLVTCISGDKDISFALAELSNAVDVTKELIAAFKGITDYSRGTAAWGFIYKAILDLLMSAPAFYSWVGTRLIAD